MEQSVFHSEDWRERLAEVLEERDIHNVFLVCGSALRKSFFYAELQKVLNKCRMIVFSDFSANPQYASAQKGAQLFRENECDMIIAVGGGSAMDVGKCIRAFAFMKSDGDYLKQEITGSGVPLIAVPATAGTGSEATQFAVIYRDGVKYSVSHESCMPDYVIFEPKLLESLPDYHKKSALLDALCHAVESFWSIKADQLSRQYAKEAIALILQYKAQYLKGDRAGYAKMMKAANLSGKAINITQTTAGHAMSYKITGLYGLAHGHAAALCVQRIWPYMLHNLYRCTDKREELEQTFKNLAEIMGVKKAEDAVNILDGMISEFDFGFDASLVKAGDLEILCDSVNIERLKNNPIYFSKEEIAVLYKQILCIR